MLNRVRRTHNTYIQTPHTACPANFELPQALYPYVFGIPPRHRMLPPNPLNTHLSLLWQGLAASALANKWVFDVYLETSDINLT